MPKTLFRFAWLLPMLLALGSDLALAKASDSAAPSPKDAGLSIISSAKLKSRVAQPGRSPSSMLGAPDRVQTRATQVGPLRIEPNTVPQSFRGALSVYPQ